MNKSVWKRKRLWLSVAICLVVGLCLSNPSVQMILKTAPNQPSPVDAQPPLSFTDLTSWETEKPTLRQAMETHLYGRYPSELKIRERSSKVSAETLNEKAHIELKAMRLINPANDQYRDFGFVLILPANTRKPLPVILTQNFCPNHNVINAPDIPIPDGLRFDCGGNGISSRLLRFFFGRYIVSPPIETILDRGYAIGIMHPPEFIPDNAQMAKEIKEQFFSNYRLSERPGNLISWAAQSVLISTHIKSDSRIGNVISTGHSRYGKSALLAAVFSPQIDGVIAHQSGTAGASLSRDKPGETLEDVLIGYPHWLGNNISSAANLPFDQHHLLALIAPRPVLLGNARRDVWSDPEGSFRAAKAATNVYGLYGSEGQTAPTLNMFVPTDDLSFWIRPGTHGVVKEDWPAFLDFLDAHFKNK